MFTNNPNFTFRWTYEYLFWVILKILLVVV